MNHREAADPRKAPPEGPLEPPLTTCPLLPQRFQFVEIPGNHYVHMNQPDHVASIIGSFLQSRNRIPAQL